MEIPAQFITDCIQRLRYYKILGDKSFEQLNETQMLHQVNEESNSIAIIIQHLHGNMISRFTGFLTTDGEKEWRNRDAEFNMVNISKPELVQLWNEGFETVFTALSDLQPADLVRQITIRSERLFVYDAILRQLAHYPYHVGQIVFIAKMLQGPAWQTLSIAKGKSKQFETEVRSGDMKSGMGNAKIN